MKKFLVTALLCAGAGVQLLNAQSKIAVFDPEGDASEVIKTVIREEISSVITSNPNFIVLERANIDKVIEENKFQGKFSSESEMSELGKMMGADYVCVITVINADPLYYIFCKQVDVNNAVIHNQGESKTSESKELICAAKESALFFALNQKDFKKTIDRERKIIKKERISQEFQNSINQQLDRERKANRERREPTASNSELSKQRKPVAAKNETKPANTIVTDFPSAELLASPRGIPVPHLGASTPKAESEQASSEEAVRFNGIDFILVEGFGGKDYYIGKYEVTQSQWRSIMGKNPPATFKGEDYPVESVNLNKILEFIAVFNKQSRRKFRLPTETEWLYAAEGGKYNESMVYAGSSDIGEVAWYAGNSEKRSHAVGLKEPNALGIYDMTGNVWEWCRERDYILHGGSWNSNANDCELPQHISGSNKKNYTHVGFRLVLPVDSR
jgi:hypothetical protein